MTNLRAMNGSSAYETMRADALRGELVGKLIAQQAVRSSEVEAAFRAVPRNLFLPGVPLEKAYANDAIVTKRDEDGVSMSSVSAPRIVAMMLEQLQVRPGHRVLEIGSGGYNAALLKELVGEDGQVTTVDIDPDVIDRARRCLAAAGYPEVNVVCADGELGVGEHAPYDRVIITVGAWDIAPAWVDQLTGDGRLVVPLRMRGLTRSVVFERQGGHLVSRSSELCGFVPMQGAGAYRERLVRLHGDQVALRVDDGQPADAGLLTAALSQPRAETWSQVTVANEESFEYLDLWLASTLSGFCLLVVESSAVERGIVSPALPWGASAVFDGGSFAYLALRPADTDKGQPRHEFGVYAHGPDAYKLAHRVAEQIRTWDRDHRSGPGPRIQAHPAGTPDEQLPEGLVIDKRHIRLTISWP